MAAYLLRRVALTAIRFSGFHRVAEFRTGGAGVILRLRHIRPREAGRQSLMRRAEITPRFFERLVRMVSRKFDVVAMAEVPKLLTTRRWRRFACLTFDSADRNFLEHAAPVLERYRLPYTLYVTSGVVDGVSLPWWFALEDIILRHQRMGLMKDGKEQLFSCAEPDDKQLLFDTLYDWLVSLGNAEREVAVRDLCGRYGFDLDALASRAMSWADIVRLAADPVVTIGAATVNYPVLARLDEASVRREFSMSQLVSDAALARRPQHLAYPYGTKGTYGRREMLAAEQAGFVTAVTARACVLQKADADRLLALPRIPVDGRLPSTSALSVIMSGLVEAET